MKLAICLVTAAIAACMVDSLASSMAHENLSPISSPPSRYRSCAPIPVPSPSPVSVSAYVESLKAQIRKLELKNATLRGRLKEAKKPLQLMQAPYFDHSVPPEPPPGADEEAHVYPVNWSSKPKPFTLTPFISSPCPPCEKWKKEAKPTLLKVANMAVKPSQSATEAKVPAPTFKLSYDGRSVSWSGYTDYKSHRDKLTKAMVKLLAMEQPEANVAETCWRGHRNSIQRWPILSAVRYRLFQPFMPQRRYAATPQRATGYQVPLYWGR